MNGRRTFIATAAALRAVRIQLDLPFEKHMSRAELRRYEPSTSSRLQIWEDCCNAVATAFANQNRAFNRELFLRNCNLPEEF